MNNKAINVTCSMTDGGTWSHKYSRADEESSKRGLLRCYRQKHWQTDGDPVLCLWTHLNTSLKELIWAQQCGSLSHHSVMSKQRTANVVLP